ncbi:unnamed protein product [Diatraea saccharalis]|uniref:Uncharacterized protein n=1 Tax=Diatraea saccharalis TaxID=40085 RepID=A0A9N9REU0_9NEOP|nr:unnamed protein product [Diatraea saccharalis]
MKTLIIFTVLLCIFGVHARNTDKNERERSLNQQIDDISSIRDYRAGQMRHRRKRWQMNYGYDYPVPPNPYYPNRRVYENEQDLIPKILRLLDEIADYVKRPPPPPAPQPIYVPYPVPYPIPQNCTCNVRVSAVPNITRRFPVLEDSNQNWGIVDTNAEALEKDDPNDGARPISFEPIKPSRPQRPPPKVEHGSTQEDITVTTQAPRYQRTTADACNAAILMCCNDQHPKACFTRSGCSMTYAGKNACSRESILATIEAYSRAYSPVV